MKVEPIIDLKSVKSIKKILSDAPRCQTAPKIDPHDKKQFVAWSVRKNLFDALHTFQVDDGLYLHLSLQFPFFFQGVENRAYKPAPQGSHPRDPAITA